jgi:hypothetical protein
MPELGKMGAGHNRIAGAFLVSLTEPFTPIGRSPFGVHDCHDPYALALVQTYHRIRKAARQCAASRRTELKESPWLTANFMDQPFDFVVPVAPKARFSLLAWGNAPGFMK